MLCDSERASDPRSGMYMHHAAPRITHHRHRSHIGRLERHDRARRPLVRVRAARGGAHLELVEDVDAADDLEAEGLEEADAGRVVLADARDEAGRRDGERSGGRGGGGVGEEEGERGVREVLAAVGGLCGCEGEDEEGKRGDEGRGRGRCGDRPAIMTSTSASKSSSCGEPLRKRLTSPTMGRARMSSSVSGRSGCD